MRKEIKDLNSYKFYLDMLKDNSPNDLRSMINGIVSDMGEVSVCHFVSDMGEVSVCQ